MSVLSLPPLHDTTTGCGNARAVCPDAITTPLAPMPPMPPGPWPGECAPPPASGASATAAGRDGGAAPSSAGGAAGPLADDAAGGTVEFRRRLVLSGDAFASVLAATATAPLALRFACRRDVDLAVSEATFAYNPWTARL
jgi:hypothetical protein